MKQLFTTLLLAGGECWVNYLLGASYHYYLIDGAIYEDAGHFFNFCGFIDAEFEDYIDFTGVSSITQFNLRK